MSDKFEIKWSKVNNDLVELNSLYDVSISNLSDGDQMIYDAGMARWTNSSYQAGTLQSTYGTTEGIHNISWGGITRPMNVAFFNTKAWAEIMFSENPVVTTPWDSWINSATNGLVSFNVVNDGLNYDSGTSSLLIVPQIMTNLLVTAKSSKVTGITDPSKTIDCSHMSSVHRNQFIDYFTGVIPGFEQLDTFGISGGIGNYDTHLGYRGGVIQTDEWLIQDSNEGDGSIGAPRWGYRSSGSTTAKTATAGGELIGPTNVFSVWATNY